MADSNYSLSVNGEAAKTTGGGQWTTLSDKRLKKDIISIPTPLETISKLNGVTYKWISPENHGNSTKKIYGFIAQDIEEIIPEWVETRTDGYKTLNTSGIEALIVESIKELKKQNQQLAQENQELRERIEKLEKESK